MIKVLIVDDEPDNVELMVRRLSRRGFEVIGAFSAEEGIARAIADRPNLILMDIKMPLVDGLAATRQLKNNSETAKVPIIALTAHAMAEDRDRALAAGADEYESKPVDLPQLIEKIEKLVAKNP